MARTVWRPVRESNSSHRIDSAAATPVASRGMLGSGDDSPLPPYTGDRRAHRVPAVMPFRIVTEQKAHVRLRCARRESNPDRRVKNPLLDQ